MKQICSILVFLLTVNIGYSQFTEIDVKNIASEGSERDLVIQSSRFLQENFYHFADILTNRLIEIDPDNPNYNYRKGFIELGMRTNHIAALKYLMKASKGKIQKNFDMYSANETAVPADVFFHLGRAYHLNEEFDLAIENYNKFISESDKRSELIKDAEKRIKQCELAKELIKSPKDVKITNLGEEINTEYADFSSNISIDGRALYYTSRRPWENNESDNYRDPMMNHFSEDIYQSNMNPFYEWESPFRMSMCVPEKNEATVSVSIDERRVYTYNDKSGLGDIYYSELSDNIFGPIIPLNLDKVNTEDRWETHYMVSPDGMMRFFTSDKIGGYGKRDIYFSEMKDGNWTEPKNIGGNINTEWDEDSPFMGLDNNVLYFSTNSERSMGEFDIMMVVRDENGIWGDPVNMGTPINSVGDDIFYTHTADGLKAFFSSFRKGGYGEKDIYEIDLDNSPVKNIAFLNGTIVHSKGDTLPENSYVTIKCLNCDDDGKEKQIFPRTRDGFFGSKLMKCKEYLLSYYYNENTVDPYTETFSTKCDLAYEEIRKRVLLDSDKEVIVPFSSYRVIASVTDRDSGLGIDSATIDFAYTSEDNHYITATDSLGKTSTTLGENKTFGDVLSFNVTISAMGYLSKTIQMNDTLGVDTLISKNFVLIKDTTGKDLGPFVILYDFDKYDLRPDAIVILDEIVKVMNSNPELSIELGSHTDSRGSSSYNKRLSNKRAKSAANYIAGKISNSKRITYKGYGESKLKNKCSNGVKCTPEEHQENRRTEFIIK